MKPSFALNITEDSIQLLHRTGRGWVPVGETAFDVPDLDDALDYMRKTALGLEPGGFSTKLVIPNSQIRYLEVEAPGPDDNSRRTQIAAALEATTPLKADEIAFDWSGKGKMVKVAALDRQTLAEAEGFAAAHRFNPVGFVAIPDYGDFSGEPWFGETSIASDLAKGDKIERDKNPIRIIARELPKERLAAATAKAEPPEDAPLPVAAEPAPEPTVEPAPEPAVELRSEPVVSADLPPELPVDLPAEAAADPVEAPVTEDLAPAPPVAVAEDPAPPVVEPAPVAADTPAARPAEPEEAPFAQVTDLSAFPEDDSDLPPMPAKRAAAVADPVTDPLVDDDLPPPPSNAALAAFASRRGTDADSRPPALGAASRPDQATLARAARGKPVEDLPPMPRPPQAGSRPAAGAGRGQGKGIASFVTAPGLAGAKKVKGKPGPLPPPPAAAPRAQGAEAAAGVAPRDAAKSLTRPGGTFGLQPPPQKSRTVLFLSLVAVLLLCLALIAAWSSFYLASRSAPEAGNAVAVAEAPDDSATPAVEDEMLADGLSPDEVEAGSPEEVAGAEDPATAAPLDDADAAPADTALTETPTDAPTDAPADTPELTETAAAAETAEPAPGISSESPASQALVENQDEIFLAASDSPPPALDALSLPAPEAAADALPAPQMPPPPFGTVYAFDEKGLLIPTPEGIVSPEGVMLIAGKPPRLPPSRSEVASAAAEAAKAAAAAVPDPAATSPSTAGLVEALPVGSAPVAAGPEAQPNPDLADRRPKSRPEGLAPAADDAALEAAPDSTVTSLRPRERPKAVLAAGEKARQETEAASLAAQPEAAPPAGDSEAQLAASASAAAANPSVVAISRRPAERPADFDQAVEAAVAAAIRAPEKPPEPEPEPAPEPEQKTAKKEPAPDIKPEEQDEAAEPEVVASAAPKIPTKASVAKQATFKNALNLSKINLIGVYGTQSKRYALIRQANGRYKKVKVGDRIDGGRIEAITQNEVRYQKGGRLVTLKMPKG